MCFVLFPFPAAPPLVEVREQERARGELKPPSSVFPDQLRRAQGCVLAAVSPLTSVQRWSPERSRSCSWLTRSQICHLRDGVWGVSCGGCRCLQQTANNPWQLPGDAIHHLPFFPLFIREKSDRFIIASDYVNTNPTHYVTLSCRI